MRRLVISVVTVGVALALAAPAFGTGRQIICWTSSGGNYIPFLGRTYNGMRFQTLIDKPQINYAGKITQVELVNYTGRTGTFNNYKLILCHCGSTSLSTTFAANYKGTPVTVANFRSFTIPASAGWFGLGMTTTTFDYNNTDHFLIEVQWLGDNGVSVPVRTGANVGGNHRVWLYDNPTGPVGSASTLTYYTRLSFGAYTPVNPTSLGRVKALFK